MSESQISEHLLTTSVPRRLLQRSKKYGNVLRTKCEFRPFVTRFANINLFSTQKPMVRTLLSVSTHA